jgi:iron complex transport system permease protein
VLSALILNIGQGEYPISPWEIVKTILGGQTGNPDHALVVMTLRLPRALVAFLAGVGLGIAGAILQGLTRNPLADPGIIGVEAGAALAAVTCIVWIPSTALGIVPIAALLGGLGVSFLIYWFSWQGGSAPLRLILVGIALGTIATSVTSLMLTFGEINSVSQALVWLAGSTYGSSWEHLIALLPWLLACLPVTLLLARDLNALNLGDELARGMGLPVEWRRGWLLLISAALTGSVVATVGTVGFIGLVAPHLSRRLVGSAHEGLIPTAGMMGGLLLLSADWIGRVSFAPIEIPCGVVTAVLGSPYLFYLLYRSQKD